MNNKIAILITTMGRESMLEKCIASIIKFRPENSIILIADQGLKDIEIIKKEKYENKGCYFYTLPYNCGLSYARNYLVKMVKEMGCEYCLLISDSMEFTESTKKVTNLILFMNKYNLIGLKLVGNVPAYWVGWISLIPGKCFELDFIDRSKVEEGKINLFPCNIVHNCFLAKINTLTYPTNWDENFKLGEHEDFMYRYNLAGYKMAWTPDISCNYIREHGNISLIRQQNWNDGIEKLKRKYNITHWIQYKNLQNGKWGIVK